MAKSSNWAVMIGASLLAIGFSAGCGQIAVPFVTRASGDTAGGQAPQVSPTPAVGLSSSTTSEVGTAPTSAARSVGPKTVPVVRDSITETLALDGVIAAQDQAPVTYPGRGNVVNVDVKVGDQVKQGDTLLEMEAPHHQWAEDIAHELDAARIKLQVSKDTLARAQAQAAAGVQAATDTVASTQQEQAVADAAAGLRHAQDNLAKVQAGASAIDRQAAQAGVDSAQAALQKAQDTADRLAAGPDPDAIRTATRDVTATQVALAKAQGALDVLTRGPDPTAVRQAQGAVTKAQTQLQLAQVAKPDSKADPAVAKIQHDAAIQDAQLALDSAQATLATLKLPPSNIDVQAARQSVQDAQDAETAAQARLDAAQAGPDQSTMDAAQAAINMGRQALAAAKKNLSDVNSHPTPSELADAQDQIRKAQSALDAAQRIPVPTPDASGSDLDVLQSAIDQNQVDVTNLEQTLDNTRLTAPFDGTIVAVRVKAGDPITSARPVFVLARPGSPIVRVDLDDDQVGRLTVGQPATIQLDGASPNAPSISASLTTLTPAAQDGSTGASADFAVSWTGDQAPKFGMPVQISMTLQQKQGVLVVPLSALHISGNHATVEVLNGTLRRLVTVEIGIRTATTVEILSGLTEGQLVLAGAST